MHTTHITQISTLFGSGYVPEQHADRMHWNLVERDTDKVVSLTASMFAEVLASLRAALKLR
jgi:hypothetical protein